MATRMAVRAFFWTRERIRLTARTHAYAYKVEQVRIRTLVRVY